MSGFKDLTGKKFGSVTILSFDRIENKQSFWMGECSSCGTVKSFRARTLPQIRTCGCRQLEPVIGRRFGRLTVVGRKIVDGRGFWECQCDCGNTTLVSNGNLLHKRGFTKSCGCLFKEISGNRLKVVRRRPKPIKVTCANCGKEFETDHWTRKHCSLTCSHRYKLKVNGDHYRAYARSRMHLLLEYQRAYRRRNRNRLLIRDRKLYRRHSDSLSNRYIKSYLCSKGYPTLLISDQVVSETRARIQLKRSIKSVTKQLLQYEKQGI